MVALGRTRHLPTGCHEYHDSPARQAMLGWCSEFTLPLTSRSGTPPRLFGIRTTYGQLG